MLSDHAHLVRGRFQIPRRHLRDSETSCSCAVAVAVDVAAAETGDGVRSKRGECAVSAKRTRPRRGSISINSSGLCATPYPVCSLSSRRPSGPIVNRRVAHRTCHSAAPGGWNRPGKTLAPLPMAGLEQHTGFWLPIAYHLLVDALRACYYN